MNIINLYVCICFRGWTEDLQCYASVVPLTALNSGHFMSWILLRKFKLHSFFNGVV